MITMGFMTLWRIIPKIKIDQALKLGKTDGLSDRSLSIKQFSEVE